MSPYVRKTESLEAAIPWLYSKGISTDEMQPALEALVGPKAKGFSASTVSRLKQGWREEYAVWRQRRVDDDQLVYMWIDGINSWLRADSQRLCALVIIGVNAPGTKQLLALKDEVHESTQSWRDVLLTLKARGMNSGCHRGWDAGILGGRGRSVSEHTAPKLLVCHKPSNVLNLEYTSQECPAHQCGTRVRSLSGDL
jgi:putative transposase